MTVALLAIQADAPPGMVAGALAALADRDVEVHQATGMVAAGLRVTTAEAPVRLRAAAYTDERPLADVAHDVVARTLHLH